MKFCVYILTHGRPDNVKTYGLLKRRGYTGPIRLVIDDEDSTANEYRERYGDEVIQFSKAEIAKTFDEADNFQDRRAIIYARNACWQIAESMGVETFLQLDDDYTSFEHRINSDHQAGYWKARDADSLFRAVCDFLRCSESITAVALAQGGDLIGGSAGKSLQSIGTKRKAMNTFFCRTDRPFKFTGRINEDVNTYTLEGSRGLVFLTVLRASIVQMPTQKSTGGMSDIYALNGTYIKSFYSILMMPSAVKIFAMSDGAANVLPRLHHKVAWNNCVPKILRPEIKRGR